MSSKVRHHKRTTPAASRFARVQHYGDTYSSPPSLPSPAVPLALPAAHQSDILSPKFALEWMSDFEKLQEALDSSGDESYMNSLNRSLALVLDEFYNALTAVSVSAASGDGMPQLFKVNSRFQAISCFASFTE